MTQMDNLQEPTKERSSAIPGVSGESRNAPYGPKAACEENLSSVQDWADTFNHKESGFRVGRTSGPAQGPKDVSSLRPK